MKLQKYNMYPQVRRFSALVVMSQNVSYNFLY